MSRDVGPRRRKERAEIAPRRAQAGLRQTPAPGPRALEGGETPRDRACAGVSLPCPGHGLCRGQSADPESVSRAALARGVRCLETALQCRAAEADGGAAHTVPAGRRTRPPPPTPFLVTHVSRQRAAPVPAAESAVTLHRSLCTDTSFLSLWMTIRMDSVRWPYNP